MSDPDPMDQRASRLPDGVRQEDRKVFDHLHHLARVHQQLQRNWSPDEETDPDLAWKLAALRTELYERTRNDEAEGND